MKNLASLLCAIAVSAAVAAVPADALADRKSPLDGQPAVRHRILLVKQRFEVSPLFETSINADFKHTIGGGLKAEYHLSDMWSFGAVGVFGTSVNTGLTTRILDTLEDTYPDGDPTPTRTEFKEHLNDIKLHGAAYVNWTPWYGKLAAFAKAFIAFDFYFSGGVAFAKLDNSCCSFNPDPHPKGDLDNNIPPDRDPNNDDPLNDGTRVGLYFAGGVHLFVNEWVAVDLAFRDYWFQDNPSGLDFDADLAVTGDDDRFLNHFFAGVGVSLFLPTKAKRTP
ncbi:MAG: outer membrane beta-barrel domain-containing protein [Deltaproteobacteria bacterium]|nr:MAG: outer membrane beta-barrel domain-containing protein [Deltaproteobacteria bacterium]